MAQNKGHIVEFHRYVQLLLAPPERTALHAALSDFASSRSVPRLLEDLKSVLDTPVKKNMYRYIRPLVPVKNDLRKAYDKLAPYSEMDSPTTVEELERQDSERRQAQQNISNLTVSRAPNEPFGLHLAGGHEIGTGIYVSRVDPGSAASRAGLVAGDLILSCNGLLFHQITMKRATEVISNTNTTLKLTVKHEGKLPSSVVQQQRVKWTDPEGQSLASARSTVSKASSGNVLLFQPRQVELSLDIGPLGFSIRGGAEHGLPIFVSSVDAGGQAERAGLVKGDEMLKVNNVSVSGMAHSDVVQLFRSSRRFILVVRQRRRVPASQQLMKSNVEFSPAPAASLERAHPRQENLMAAEKARLHEAAQQLLNKALKRYLAPAEASRVHQAVLSYQRAEISVPALVDVLRACLKTAQQKKIELDVRQLLRSRDLDEYDRLLQEKPAASKAPARETSSDHSDTNAHTPERVRTTPRHVSLNKGKWPKEQLGLALWGGSDSPMPAYGVCIRRVEAGSAARRCEALRPGLQVFAINHIPVGACTHAEVVEMMRTALERDGDELVLTVGRQPVMEFVEDDPLPVLEPSTQQMLASTDL